MKENLYVQVKIKNNEVFFYFYIQKIFVFERIETFQSLFATENYKNENQLARTFLSESKKIAYYDEFVTIAFNLLHNFKPISLEEFYSKTFLVKS